MLRVSPASNDDPGVSSLQSTVVSRGSVVVPTNQSRHSHSSGQNRQNEGQAWENIGFITAPSAVQPDQAGRPADNDKWKHHRVDSGKEFLAPPSTGGNKRPKHDRTFSASPTLGPGSTVDATASFTTAQPQASEELPNDMRSTRVAIQRQLRFLFIYPVVYICLWTPAFAFHCTQYNDYLAFHPPYWLQVTTLITINIQAAADSLIFMWRERPWRRVQHQTPGPLSRLTGRLLRKFGRTPRQKSVQATRPQLDRSMGSTTVHWWEREEEADEADASGENGSDSLESAKFAMV